MRFSSQLIQRTDTGMSVDGTFSDIAHVANSVAIEGLSGSVVVTPTWKVFGPFGHRQHMLHHNWIR
jgi:hypothetical protein